ncbi:hypothetical protein D3273_22655 [Lichenibacterium minor]|uniref:Uncharacterized protein n=1 Tax=Lichenibacterium minor TaxID=2316528 RepID=A0A4Q2TZV1_9HYPH|nr:hypothetical protein [Lichenibacterium minor]RYC29679.1 hypothetical protein D3273_22655 [Lichenibacterium minor]
MSLHATSSAVVRFPPRLRVVPKWEKTTSALDALLSAGTIDDRQHAAGLAYGRLRRRYEDGIVWARLRRSPMSDDAWVAVKRDHAALIRAAGAERFVLDRLCLDDDAPLRCEVERVRVALGRMIRPHCQCIPSGQTRF